MFSIAKKNHWLQSIVVRLVTSIHPAIDHNLSKISGLKKAFYFANLERIPGDYVEFGMYEGTSFIAAFESHMNTNSTEQISRSFWGFDSFEGFKYSSINDVHPFFREGDFKSSYEQTKRRIANHFKGRVNWNIVPGYVENTAGVDTALNMGIDKVAIAFIDLDLGEPARIALNFLRPSLQCGSIIILDDYFAYKGDSNHGVAGAFRAFCNEHPQLRFRRLFDYGYGGQAFVLSNEVLSNGE